MYRRQNMQDTRYILSYVNENRYSVPACGAVQHSARRGGTVHTLSPANKRSFSSRKIKKRKSPFMHARPYSRSRSRSSLGAQRHEHEQEKTKTYLATPYVAPRILGNDIYVYRSSHDSTSPKRLRGVSESSHVELSYHVLTGRGRAASPGIIGCGVTGMWEERHEYMGGVDWIEGLMFA
ncbi:hypothetical protein CC80DRAFT_584560 [Byssothecium circinans]|uniref:Uncharacterized protein n=1 Tax=Byssothecium circinans TaxID=147558 RepID=A0A6A5U584_9PLEO|nr:hypothetical protein CC80DRAFT_584560 [Byssothecium circinans]